MTRQQRLTLVATILGSTIVFLDSTVVNVALPAIGEDLGAGLAGQQWIFEAYLLALVSLLLVGGAMGDQFGRRRLFTIGLIGFGVTSAACALAPSTEILIAARAFQGFAGALLVPGSLALIAAAFEGPARGRAVGTWTAWSGIATVMGPAGGGALVDGFSWQWIFWINLPLVVLTLYLTRIGVAESRDPEAAQSIDFAGVGLSAVGLGGPVFALIEQPSRGWSDPLVYLPLICGLAALAAFFWRERRTAEPMLDLSLFRNRIFSVVNASTLTIYAALSGSTFFLTLFLQQVAGYSALQAGLATTPISVLLFFLSPSFGRLAVAVGPRLPMSAGPALAGVGILLLAGLGPDPDYVADILPGVILFGLGLSATVAPLTATVLDAVAAGKVGAASGVNNAVARVAGLLAIAVIGALVSAQFATTLDEKTAALPRTAPVERALAQSRAAVFSQGDAAKELPDGQREVVEAAARDASSEGLRIGLLVSAALMWVGAGTSLIGLPRGAGRGSGDDDANSA